MTTVDEHDSLTAVPADEWNKLVADSSFYLSHQWLAAQDEGQPVEPRYLTVRLDGRLVGALPTYVVQRETNSFYEPVRCADGRWTGRYLIGGARRAYANDVLTDAGLDPTTRGRVTAALVAAADRHRADRGLDATLFLYLGTDGARRVNALRPAAVPVFLTAEALLDLPGDDIGDWLRSRPEKRRREVRREMRRFEQGGLTVEEVPVERHWRHLADLFGAVQRRYGHGGDADQWRRVVERQTMRVRADTVLLGCRRGTELIGAVLLYPWYGTAYVKLVGFDYGALAGRYEYFNLVYYAVIRYAYATGLRRVHFGREAVEAKVRRGAYLRPLWGLALADGAAEEWNGRAGARWRAAHPWAAGSFTDGGWSMWGLSPQPKEST